MIRPPRLRQGDRVAVIAPSGPVVPEAFAEGVARLAGRYELYYDDGLFERRGFLAGSDERRLRELERALDDERFAAVFCARGGHGALRLLPSLPAGRFARRPRILLGFSDVTALHARLLSDGVASVHGPVISQLGRLGDEDLAGLCALLESDRPAAPWTGLTTVAPGRAEGFAVGGNLEVLSRLLGTPYLPPLDGAVLFLEEVGERPYRLDRALTQLRLAGVLARAAAIVVGDLIRCEEPDGSADPRAVILERLGALPIPVVADAPFGHGARNRAFAHGGRVRVDAARGTIEFLDAAVA